MQETQVRFIFYVFTSKNIIGSLKCNCVLLFHAVNVSLILDNALIPFLFFAASSIPSKGDILFNIGCAYDKMKQYDDAVKYYHDALSEYE